MSRNSPFFQSTVAGTDQSARRSAPSSALMKLFAFGAKEKEMAVSYLNQLVRYSQAPSAAVLALASHSAYRIEKAIAVAGCDVDPETGVSPVLSGCPATALAKTGSKDADRHHWPAGWELDSFSRVDKKHNTYLGMVFRHEGTKQMILACRGSQTAQDWQTDIKLVRQSLAEQFVCAITHAMDVHRRAEEGGYQLTVTGHSLGGALAIVGLYSIKRFLHPEARKVDLTSAVTFDNPGMRTYLKALQPKKDKGDWVDLDELDITCYLSGDPNLVNSCGEHVGSLIALKAEAQSSDAIGPNTLVRTALSHPMGRLIRAFDSDMTGAINTSDHWRAPVMKNWPQFAFAEEVKFPVTGGDIAKAQVKSTVRAFKRKVTAPFKRLWGTLFSGSQSASAADMQQSIETRSGWGLAHMIADWSRVMLGFSELIDERLTNDSYLHYWQLANNDGDINFEALEKHGPEGVPERRQAMDALLRSQWEESPFYNDSHYLHKRHLPAVVYDCFSQMNIQYGYYTEPSTYERLLPYHGGLFSQIIDSETGELRYTLVGNQTYLRVSSEFADARAGVKTLIDWLASSPAYLHGPTWDFKGQLLRVALDNQDWQVVQRYREEVEQRVNSGWELLKRLRGFQSASRLYLFGAAPEEDSEHHKTQSHELQQHLLQNEGQIRQINEYLAQAVGLSPTHQDTLAKLLERLTCQRYLLTVGQTLSEALYLLKTRQPGRLIALLDPVLNDEKDIALFLNGLVTETLSNAAGIALGEAAVPIRGEIIKGSAYVLRGKAYRQQCNPSLATAAQKQSVIDNYEAALSCFEEAGIEDISTLSSLASFYDDIGRSQEAETLHRRAFNLLPLEMDTEEAKNRWAVTASNLAGCLTQCALASDDNALKKKYLYEARYLLNESIHLKANGGSYLYRSQVYRCLGELEGKDYSSKIRGDIELGLKVDGRNLKLRLARARVLLNEGETDLALEEAYAIECHARQRQEELPEYEGYAEDAAQLMEQVNKVDEEFTTRNHHSA